jgi:lipid-binding SYLF domain-containing protein
MKKILLVIVLLAGMLSIGSVLAALQTPEKQSDEVEQIQRSVEVFRDLLALPEEEIPPALLRKSQAIAIIPGFLKAAYVVGGEHGRGVVLVRTDKGEWSNPSFISMTGGSIGFQIGVEKADIILVFKNRASVDNIAKGKFTLGGDASVAVGPMGRSAKASTDIALEAEVYSYSKAKGIFAGVSISGASLQMDKGANERFYRVFDITAQDILYKDRPVPAAAQELKEILAKYTK